MATLDYIVATFIRTSRVEAREPHILASLANGKRTAVYGYTGMTHKSITYAISRDGRRALVAGTGSAAHEAGTLVYTLADEGLSIARLDIQETIIVDNPDRTIMFLTPKKVYGGTRVSAINGEGETLYVGSPKSRARLRVYNKSAESGLTPDQGKYLRVEVQLRDSYADQAYRLWLDGQADNVLSYWIGKMLEESSARDLHNLCKMLCVDRIGQVEPEDEDWIGRRKIWFERSVVPAMARLFLVDPDYVQVAVRLLTGNAVADDNGTDQHESD